MGSLCIGHARGSAIVLLWILNIGFLGSGLVPDIWVDLSILILCRLDVVTSGWRTDRMGSLMIRKICVRRDGKSTRGRIRWIGRHGGRKWYETGPLRFWACCPLLSPLLMLRFHIAHMSRLRRYSRNSLRVLAWLRIEVLWRGRKNLLSFIYVVVVLLFHLLLWWIWRMAMSMLW